MAYVGHKIAAHLPGLRHLRHIVEAEQDDPMRPHRAQADVIGGAVFAANAGETRLAGARPRKTPLHRFDQPRLAQCGDKVAAQQPLAQQVLGGGVQNGDPLFRVDGHARQRQCGHHLCKGHGGIGHVRAV